MARKAFAYTIHQSLSAVDAAESKIVIGGLTLADDKVKPQKDEVVRHRDPLRTHAVSRTTM